MKPTSFLRNEVAPILEEKWGSDWKEEIEVDTSQPDFLTLSGEDIDEVQAELIELADMKEMPYQTGLNAFIFTLS